MPFGYISDSGGSGRSSGVEHTQHEEGCREEKRQERPEDREGPEYRAKRNERRSSTRRVVQSRSPASTRSSGDGDR